MLGIAEAAVLCLLVQAQTYKAGDRVEAYDAGWHKGVVTQAGSGSYQGYYLVKYDAFSTSRWFKPDSLRPGGPPDAPKSYPAYKVGDRVEGYDFGWYAGVVTEVRPGKDSSEYLIKYDKFSSARWYHPRDMRSATAAQAELNAAAQATADGPRLGKYNVYSYGATSTPPLFLGPYAEPEWGGKFSVDGTRHRIALRSRTIGSNSP